MIEVECINSRDGFDIPAVGETYWINENEITTHVDPDTKSSDTYVSVYNDNRSDSYLGQFNTLHFKIIDGYEVANVITYLMNHYNKLSAELDNFEELFENGVIGKSKIQFKILSDTMFEGDVTIPISNDIVHPLMQSLRSYTVYTRDRIMGLMSMLLAYTKDHELGGNEYD